MGVLTLVELLRVKRSIVVLACPRLAACQGDGPGITIARTNYTVSSAVLAVLRLSPVF